MKKLFTLTLLALVAAGFAQNEKIQITEWLSIPVQELSYPVFHDAENTQGKLFLDENLLNFDHFHMAGHLPEVNQTFVTVLGKDLKWEVIKADEAGMLNLGRPSAQAKMTYLAAYIYADRWMQATLEISSPYLMKAWLDGELAGTKTKVEDDAEKAGKITKALKLERGKHLLIVKTLIPAGKELPWNLSASLEVKDPFATSDIQTTTRPVNRKNIYHLMDGVKITGISPSHDGKYYTISYRQSLPPSDESESWTEIRSFHNKQIVHSFRHARVSQITWLPLTNRISYVASQKDKSTLYLFDFEAGQITPLLQDVEKLGGYRWSPTEEHIIYTIREEAGKRPEIMDHILGMEDRLPGWRNRSFLYSYEVMSGKMKQLTWGNISTSLHDISPDGKRIIFSQHFTDYNERPFSKQNLFIMTLANLSLDTIHVNESWGVRASFSTDGKLVMATGGPSAFNGAGLNIPEGTIPHDSDTQVYIYNPADKSVRAITRNFDPSVESAHWHSDNHIYLHTADQDYSRLYRYDVRNDRFTLINTGVDFISSVSFANNAPLAVFGGNQTNKYTSFYVINLSNLRSSPLEDTEGENYSRVEFGDTRNWDFTAESGVNITGRVYYPPGFDPEKKYPLIVYYYGGIRPVGRTFGGRYPFNLWAGNDYLVYVLQPSGAVGFGQEFSAAHVNNWGFTVADEIIEGTQKFLEAHPYADAEKVGCAGASYGGFMTMLLLTRTDIFAAAISHAGISSISSYWGEGFWGYSYSAGASAYSFPWNNKDLYIGQSPLFHADKINTPLLLVTGDADTNVPPGESIQMYTALKLLDRPVELVLVKGENHHIITYNKRIQWHRSIMAWWDKYLKDQPEWWDDQFPKGNY
jgi:dipeptidyl aminopeptidase/acylaminoacyl peptidase